MSGSHHACRRTFHWAVFLITGFTGLLLASPLNARSSSAPQSVSAGSHVTIPFLANATKPTDLDFQGGDCNVDRTGATMACRFQQVFLTISPLDARTCVVTTNRYEQVFRKDGDARWTSREAPDGACGVVEVTTLMDGGGVKWTLETRKVVTKKAGAPACRNMEDTTETLSWQNLRRPLPCAFVQPGALTP